MKETLIEYKKSNLHIVVAKKIYTDNFYTIRLYARGLNVQKNIDFHVKTPINAKLIELILLLGRISVGAISDGK